MHFHNIYNYLLLVFLGGSCNPTTWRNDIVIPLLRNADVSFYNPQVKEWNTDLVKLEQEAKRRATVLLFVINHLTRGVASMLEALELMTVCEKCVDLLMFYCVD